MCEAFEVTKPSVDLIMRQLLHPFGAKFFDVERPHHRPEDHGATQSASIELFLTRQITHQTTCERASRTRPIKDRFQRISGNRKVFVPAEHGRAVLSALDDPIALC